MRLWRALLLGLVLAPANAYWVIQMERVRAGPYVSSISLFANCVFVLAVLAALNLCVRRYRPRWAMTPGELLLVYSMCCLGTAVAGMDFLQVLVMILGHAKHFATPENGWESFFRYIPSWLVVNDVEALKRYHGGHSSLWLPENYHPYLVPCIAWMTFVAALLLAMQGLNALLARPWIERERLSFPVLELPLTLAREPVAFYRQPSFLIGVTIPVMWCGLNGLHFLYPAVPEISVKPFDLVQGATSKPIRAMTWMPVTFYPFAIGLGYLLPTDLLFSAWFFYFFWKLELAFSALMAWDVNPHMPYASQQSMGACLALMCYLVYTSRGYLREAGLALRGRGPAVGHRAEYHAALAAFLAGAGYQIFFSRVAGMSWLMIGLFWGLYLVTVTVVTRMRAELGPPVHDFHLMGPEIMITTTLGT
ncbi:MAG: hypothetical protein HYU66_11750, partial [Armatimonadetes bacterium]|nr:hypothetical protein [Armatimonadota bacterium]